MKSSLLFIFLFLLFKPELKANSGNNSPMHFNSISQENTSILNIKDKADKTIIIWESKSSTEKINTQIFAQRLDETGEALWGKTVELTSDSNRIQNSHKLISDGKGGVIITWEERSIDNEETDVYAQHIDSLGIKLWGPKGKILSSATGSQISPMIASDGAGGAVIVWTDSRNDLTFTNWDIYAQHITSSGELTWEKDGLLISADVKDEYLGKVLSGADGGVTIVWNKVITSFSDETEGYEFHFRKLNPNGETVQLLNSENFLTLPASNTNYSLGSDILSDNNDGFFLSLTMNGSQTDTGLYLQHVLASGDLAFAGSYGLLIDSSIQESKNIRFETDSIGSILVHWMKKDSVFTIANSLKFDISGNQLPLHSYLDETGLQQNVYKLLDTLTENIETITKAPLIDAKSLANNIKSDKKRKIIYRSVSSFTTSEILTNKVQKLTISINPSKLLFDQNPVLLSQEIFTALPTQVDYNYDKNDGITRNVILNSNFYKLQSTENPGYNHRGQLNKNSKTIVAPLYILASSG